MNEMNWIEFSRLCSGEKRRAVWKCASPSPRPSPLGRGRNLASRSANSRPLGFSHLGLSLSLGERENGRHRVGESGRVGNAADRAQAFPLPWGGGKEVVNAPDQFSCRGSCAKPRRGGVRPACSPSPRPSPLGRGRMADTASANRAALEMPQIGPRYSLSLGERVRVRGNRTFQYPAAEAAG
jgi:hypothetical protein